MRPHALCHMRACHANTNISFGHHTLQIKEIIEKIYNIPDGMSTQAKRPQRVSSRWRRSSSSSSTGQQPLREPA